MSQDIVVELQKREVIGKGLNKLRTDGVVPAVVHNPGEESTHVMGNFQELTKVYSQAGKHHAVQLKFDGKEQLAIIKHADFDPKKHQIRHLVFQAIKQNEKLTTEVPIVLEGDAPAEMVGLLVITNVDTVEIEAFPKDLPDNLVVDATGLAEIGDKLHVSNLVVPSGVTVLTDPETTIAVVEETKAQISEESEEETEGEEGEGEESEEGEGSSDSSSDSSEETKE